MSDLVAQKALLTLSEKVDLVEKEFLKHEQVSCPVVHRFSPGVYIRELSVKAGTFLIGHHQNFEQMNVFLKGRVSVKNDDGSVSELTAPMSFVGKPGRKIGYVHEDMVWMNVYATNETDVEKLEAHFLTKSDAFFEREKLEQLKSSLLYQDFLAAIEEIGFSEEEVRRQSVDDSDLVALPFGAYKIKVAKSAIEGEGLFATADIESGEQIAPARLDGKRTIAGRFTNHSSNPNAQMVRGVGDEIFLQAKTPILGCRGGLDGDEITVDYRQAFKLNCELANRGETCQV